ncbi:hypothetical protein DY000_02013808 [Brassica cretica]|uniref:Uncharacterized protein n=1 Tax=Brassica cretica TaxID=69181 RepID=A0ABQ7CT01_BRACR|nr:hypothetical protein DY000_02013808 [Brassica cretica]
MAPDACAAAPRAPRPQIISGCMSRTHAGRHHSSHMSGCMPGVHARRHTSTHMSISMLRLHARRHLVLGRSTSYFYVSGCMDCFHARRHLELLETLSCLDGSYHVLAIYIETPRDSWSVYAIFDPSDKFLTRDQSRIFFRSRSDAVNIFNRLQMNSDIL